MPQSCRLKTFITLSTGISNYRYYQDLQLRTIAFACISGSWLVDRFAAPNVACAAHALALCSALLLTFWPSPSTTVLGLVGLAYGFVSGATAGGIAIYWRPADYGRVAGRTYIAWCLAAISLPVLAGYLFDVTRQYSAAMMIAVGANIAGMAMALTLPRLGWRATGGDAK